MFNAPWWSKLHSLKKSIVVWLLTISKPWLFPAPLASGKETRCTLPGSLSQQGAKWDSSQTTGSYLVFFQIFWMSCQFSKTDKNSQKQFGVTQSCRRGLFCAFLLTDFKPVNSFLPFFALSFQAANALGKQEIAFLSMSGALLVRDLVRALWADLGLDVICKLVPKISTLQ